MATAILLENEHTQSTIIVLETCSDADDEFEYSKVGIVNAFP